MPALSKIATVGALTFLSAAEGLKTIPERARGGHFNDQFSGLKATSATTWGVYESKIDNFSDNSTSTFSQRYAVDATYWDGKGPIFYEIGGEGTLGGAPDGYIATLAQNYSALLIALEHRFYGESIPNNDMSTENLKYLTVEQALADLANFIDYYKVAGNTGDSTWFIFGGSYPGALSSWFRAAYPDKTAGALSSSGVVNAIIDFPQFDMQVSAALGNKCADQIRRTESAFERMISTPSGWKSALDLFSCESDMWKEDFFYMIADSWSMADQYGSKQPLCDTMLAVGENASDEVLTKTFAEFSNSYWGSDFCSMGFYNTESLADPKRWDANSRSWRWQTCYQVSYFNTAPKSGSLRSTTVDLDYHLRQCAKVFGKPMFPASVALNEKFGGEFPKATKVFYSDFSDDPWQRASVSYPVSSDQPYDIAMCDGCGHCRDFHSATENDPVELQNLRAEFDSYLYKWLQEAETI